MKNKIKLPPRKWYSLQQAAEKLSQETNQTITSGDLLHYANQGLLELSVRIDFKNIDNDNFTLSIHNSNLDNVIDEIYYLDVHCWQGYEGKTNFIKTPKFKAVLRDDFDFKEAFNKVMKSGMNSEDGLADIEAIFTEVNNKSIPIYDGLINDEYFIEVRTNIENLNGFFAIDFNNFDEIFIDEQNPQINLMAISFRPSRGDNIENGFGFVIEGRDFHGKQIITLNKDSIFIVPEELETSKQGGKQIRNLDSFESFIEEWKSPTRINKPNSIFKENVLVDEIGIKAFQLERVPFIDMETPNEEFNQPEKNKGGRPPIKYKKEIILLAEKIFKAYPEHNRERIKEAILELVNNQNYFNDPNFKINEVTTTNILRKKEIGIPRGKSTPIKALEQFK
ncbi:hypothetical protein [uncultured Aggregatibacter sp.]|uniref:hypothetical protein n=1 Tax=uncultured Aggregatibacter sp. TaxID=470564 RepID=UPI002597E6DC|nr:hypothetical protein [uncultured Aggregatibacter sp.]